MPPGVVPKVPSNLPTEWEKFCREDVVRNQLIVPFIVEQIAQLKPLSVIDIACGTGYVSAKILIEEGLKPLCWRLLDFNGQMIDFAYNRLKHLPFVERHHADLRNKNEILPIPPSDLAFVCLSLLELKVDYSVAKNLLTLANPTGSLLIIIPDLLADIASSRDSANHLEQYIDGYCELTKMERDFGGHYPFCANRIEFFISSVLAAGAYLKSMDILNSPNQSGVFFCLHFVRADTTGARP